MSKEKKIWLIEQYAQQAWSVSMVLAQEAARAGDHGKGYAVVAHEARSLANKMYSYVAELRFENPGEDMFKKIADSATMFRFLAVNAALEILNTKDVSMDFNIPKSMSVFAEELRRIATSLNELADVSLRTKPMIIPELASPSEAAGMDAYFLYSIEGYPLIENPSRIKEVVLYPHNTVTHKKMFSIRGRDIPIIDCRKLMNLRSTVEPDGQTIIIVYPEGKKSGKTNELYAVPIDDLDINAVFYSRMGRSALPNKKHAFAEYARETWDVVGDDQVMFVDWQKLVKSL